MRYIGIVIRNLTVVRGEKRPNRLQRWIEYAQQLLACGWEDTEWETHGRIFRMSNCSELWLDMLYGYYTRDLLA
jgi:hypothetical protein